MTIESSLRHLWGVQTDYIVVGQGLCGTWLSYYLMRAGASVVVVDPGFVGAASAAASGIINPITGKRLARQWMGERILPFAKEAYRALGDELSLTLATELSIHTFFSTAEEASFFEAKATAMEDGLLSFGSHMAAADNFNSHYGIGSIHPALLVEVRRLLEAWREVLIRQHSIMHEAFDWDDCKLGEDGVRYRDIRAKAVIDCSGPASASNPNFKRLPFALNKGEAIIASIPHLPREGIYKYAHLSIVPWEPDQFWIGSTFDWNFTDALPTAAFRHKAESILSQWLKLPYTIQEHFAAVRPATVTRDAFAGLHPHHPQLGLLNGMGSKGCSLAPFLAHNFAQHLTAGQPMIAQVELSRYARVLGG